MSALAVIPRHIDYRRAALEARTFDGRLSLEELPRTADVVVGREAADVAVSLAFEEDSQRRVIIRGRAVTTLVLSCQRCLEPTDVTIDASVAGLVVASDEAAASVPRAWEPILAESDRLDLHALVDDELLLALPFSIHCDRPTCQARYAQYSTDNSDEAGVAALSDKPNPFAALADLKRRGNDSD